MINTKKTPTNQQLLDYCFLGQSQLVGKYLQNTQENHISKNHDKISSSNNSKLSSIMKTILPNWEGQSVAKAQELLQPNISDIPTFHTSTISLPEVTVEMRATLSRLSSEACKRALLSEEIRSVLRNAKKYGIAYIQGIQYTEAWDSFADKVYQWEDLLEDADELHVEWRSSNYDPAGLSQAIEDEKNELWIERQEWIKLNLQLSLKDTRREKYCLKD
jgi:hypothetical protein